VGFGAGGTAALDSIEQAGYDVLKQHCSPHKLAFARRAFSDLVAAGAGRGRL
jgi:hypothetical protein